MIDVKKALRDVLAVVGQVVPGAKGAADMIDKVLGGKSPDGADLTPEQQSAITNETDRHAEALAALDTDALKLIVQEAVAGIQSGDKVVSRARPTQVYAFVLVNLIFATGIVTGWHPDNLQMELVGAVELALGGTSAWYSKLRSDDKKNAT